MTTRLSLPLFATLLVGIMSGAHGAKADEPPTEWTGHYEFAGDDKELSNVSKAIERATKELGVVLQRVARSRLRAVTRPYREFRFEVIGATVRAWLERNGPWETETDGRWIKTENRRGTKVEVSHRLSKGGLVQTIKTRQGLRTNRYTFSPDGKLVTLDVRISAEKLPSPVVFQLTYERT